MFFPDLLVIYITSSKCTFCVYEDKLSQKGIFSVDFRRLKKETKSVFFEDILKFFEKVFPQENQHQTLKILHLFVIFSWKQTWKNVNKNVFFNVSSKLITVSEIDKKVVIFAQILDFIIILIAYNIQENVPFWRKNTQQKQEICQKSDFFIPSKKRLFRASPTEIS